VGPFASFTSLGADYHKNGKIQNTMAELERKVHEEIDAFESVKRKLDMLIGEVFAGGVMVRMQSNPYKTAFCSALTKFHSTLPSVTYMVLRLLQEEPWNEQHILISLG
jgi:hypothetical protein